jgi:hypothetical protein
MNSTGVTRQVLGNSTQILADANNQSSIGCVVDAAVGVTVGSQKIAKAGTPISMDLQNISTPAVLATASVKMTGVLLHDVDVTNGNNNGTALIFGFVNVNRLATDVQTLVTAAAGNANASKLVTFLKV